ncbi:MAG TPA: phage portal protein [Blastocatellia bacterium]|nr:phage portal protein [Blastocatellia bacterium]
MSRLTDILKNAISLRIYSSQHAERLQRELAAKDDGLLDYKTRISQLEAEIKSLRDAAITGEYDSSSGLISLYPPNDRSSDGFNTTRFFKKRNVRMLRSYAEYSVWVRAAIDIYRNVIEQAEWTLGPEDSNRPTNEESKREISNLLKNPNPAGTPYSLIKGQMIEDFLVLGHGAIEKAINRDQTPYQLIPLDAAKIAFVPGWDGTDPTKPRYAQLDSAGSKVLRWFPNSMLMVMVARARTYDPLGLSNVEMLDFCVRALLEGDDYLLNNVLNGSPSGILNLGMGVTKQQVDDFRQQITAAKKSLAIVGGTENSSYIRFTGTEREMRVLDTLPWFVRQVAAIFQLSTASLRLAVDQSRANTEAMFENDQEGPVALLWHIRQTENANIVKPFDIRGTDNLILDYPLMSRRDELQQAEISQIQTGGLGWSKINEARREAGLDPLDLPIAEEVLIDTPAGPVPLSKLNELHFGRQGGADIQSARTD